MQNEPKYQNYDRYCNLAFLQLEAIGQKVHLMVHS